LLDWIGTGNAIGTYLDLIDSWRPDLGKLLQLLEHLDGVIAHANLPHLARLLRLLERSPHELPRLGAAVRAMDQEQINVAVFAVELLDALDNRRVRGIEVCAGRQDLACQENVGALEARGAHGFADGCFVGVVLRGVDVTVAGAQGVLARRCAHAGWGEVNAEAELGDFGRGGEGEC
jgi:hypothetical protein